MRPVSDRTNAERDDDLYAALGHIIKVLRTDMGIDRKRLAERADISYSYMASIENGQKRPSSQVLIALANALGLRTAELFDSAESRIERNRRSSVTHEYPQWLAAGDSSSFGAEVPLSAPRMAAAASKERATASPRRMAQTSKRSTADPVVQEISALAERLTEGDRETLLHLARRLAAR